MKKQVSVAMDNLRRSVNTNDDLPAVAARWGVQEFGGPPMPGTDTGADPTLPSTDAGTSGSNQEAGCTPPSPAIPIGIDPRDADGIGRGREVFERLTASGSSYVPSLRVEFYRAVWFDGLEAYREMHYTVSGGNRLIIPFATLSGDVQVSARYVVR